MDQVKIRVQSADGKDRGSLFTDGIWDKNRWMGAPKPNLQEVMVCTHELESGEWFLIEYVLPRQIVGEAENGSLFDPASSCCRRTPLQALHWFSQQAFGPPPALVERVRRFAAKWPSFCSSPSAKAMLETIVQRHFVRGDDPLFSGEAQLHDRALLRDLELVFGSGPSDEGDDHANMLIEDVGVEGFIAWTNGHLDLLTAASRAHEVQSARKGLHDAVIGLEVNLPTDQKHEQPLNLPPLGNREATAEEAPAQPQSWDSRTAFHLAIMAVYLDLGKLIQAVASEPNRRLGLVHLDEVVARHSAPERGDLEIVWRLKNAVGQLRTSLATVRKIRDHDRDVGGSYWLGNKVERSWGGISSGSYHEVLLGAAWAMLERVAEHRHPHDAAGKPPVVSGTIRNMVIADGLDQQSWATLAQDLEHEFQCALRLPKPAHNYSSPIAEAPTHPPTEQQSGRRRKGRKTARRELSDMAVLVLRVLPNSRAPALRTLEAISKKLQIAPKPSLSSISRAVTELRGRSGPLVDLKSYRATQAGDRERAKHQ